MANTVLALNLLLSRASSRWAKGPMTSGSRLATTAASPKAQRRYGLPSLSTAQALDLPGAGDGAFDEAAIREKILHGGKAGDVADLVENGQPEVIADTGCGLQQGEVAAGSLFGESEEFLFEAGQLGVVMTDEGQIVLQGELAHWVRLGRKQLFAPGLPVVSQLMGLQAGQEFAAVPDIEQALAEQSAERTFFRRIDVARGNEVGAEEMGDLLGVNAVVLVFAAVNGLEVERVGQDEMDAGRPYRRRRANTSRTCTRRRRSGRGDRARRVEEIGEVIVFDVGVDELFAVAVQHADIHLAGRADQFRS